MIKTVKKIVNKDQRRSIRVGTVKKNVGVRYQVEDDLGGTHFCFAEQPWAPGARVTMVDDKITGPGPDKTPISVFEV